MNDALLLKSVELSAMNVVIIYAIIDALDPDFVFLQWIFCRIPPPPPHTVLIILKDRNIRGRAACYNPCFLWFTRHFMSGIKI